MKKKTTVYSTCGEVSSRKKREVGRAWKKEGKPMTAKKNIIEEYAKKVIIGLNRVDPLIVDYSDDFRRKLRLMIKNELTSYTKELFKMVTPELKQNEHRYYWSDDSKSIFYEGVVDCVTKAPKNADTLMDVTSGYKEAVNQMLRLQKEVIGE